MMVRMPKNPLNRTLSLIKKLIDSHGISQKESSFLRAMHYRLCVKIDKLNQNDLKSQQKE